MTIGPIDRRFDIKGSSIDGPELKKRIDGLHNVVSLAIQGVIGDAKLAEIVGNSREINLRYISDADPSFKANVRVHHPLTLPNAKIVSIYIFSEKAPEVYDSLVDSLLPKDIER